MKNHPDDARLLAEQTWLADAGPCIICRHTTRPVTQVGESGGQPVLICRDDLSWRLHFARCESIDAGVPCEPRMPVMA